MKDILLTSQIFCHAERAWETQSRNKQLWVTWGVSTPSDFRKASLPPKVVRATHGNTMVSFHVFNCFLEKKHPCLLSTAGSLMQGFVLQTSLCVGMGNIENDKE